MGWKGPPKLTNSLPEVWLRVGLLASDPLRILGLEAIFADESGIEMVPLTGVLDVADLSLVMIDAVYTDHLFELLAMLRRKHPRLKMIVIGIDTDPAYIQRVIGAGVKGYLTHMAKESEIRMAIDIVQDGSVWAPRKVLAKLLESSSAIASEPAVQVTPKITQREEQVLRLLVAGRANREIASSLGIDAVTVKAHVGRLMRKVGVQNRIALSMHAVTRNLLQK
jgi:DNA-binding NarL/FixJ family response regulator